MGKGFWDAAEKAAGEAYGRKYAERYERWERFTRSVGWIALVAVGAYVVGRTWGAMLIGPLLYGAGALLVFAGCTGLAYAYVRIRRTRRERTRTYVEW